MGAAASRARGQAGSRLRYVKEQGEKLASEQRPPDPLVAASPGPLGEQETQIAKKEGKIDHDPVQELRADPALSRFLDQLGGSVAKRPAQAYAGKDPITRTSRHNKTDKEAIQRISLLTIRALLEDSKLPKYNSGGRSEMQHLAEGYGVDPELLDKVLRYNAVPAYKEEEDGRIVGSWPE